MLLLLKLVGVVVIEWEVVLGGAIGGCGSRGGSGGGGGAGFQSLITSKLFLQLNSYLLNKFCWFAVVAAAAAAAAIVVVVVVVAVVIWLPYITVTFGCHTLIQEGCY